MFIQLSIFMGEPSFAHTSYVYVIKCVYIGRKTSFQPILYQLLFTLTSKLSSTYYFIHSIDRNKYYMYICVWVCVCVCVCLWMKKASTIWSIHKWSLRREKASDNRKCTHKNIRKLKPKATNEENETKSELNSSDGYDRTHAQQHWYDINVTYMITNYE